MGRILLPPGGIGDGAAIAQETAIPVLAPTHAAILCLQSANAAFQLVVGTRKVLPVIALHQVRTQVREHLQELSQTSLFQFRERAIRSLLSQFFPPRVQTCSHRCIAHDVSRLHPLTREKVFGIEDPLAHAFDLPQLLFPGDAFCHDSREASQLLHAPQADGAPF